MARNRPSARRSDAKLGLRHPDPAGVVRAAKNPHRPAAGADRRQPSRGDRVRPAGRAGVDARVTLLGVCCGIAGISAAAQFGLAVANLFDGLKFDVIAAVLVGGIALRGGQGSPIQAALGAVFIALLQNFMLLHEFTTGWRMFVVGSLVALATFVFHLLQKRHA